MRLRTSAPRDAAPVTRETTASTPTVQTLRDVLPLLRERGDQAARRASMATLFSVDADIATASVAASLAKLASRSGLSVLLVDANLASPAQHQLFGVANVVGVVDVLAGTTRVQDAIRRTDSGVDLIAAGHASPDSDARFDGAELTSALHRLGDHYEVILIDGRSIPPLGARALAAGVDNALVVVSRHRSSTRDLRALLASVGPELLHDPIILLAE